MIFRCLSFLSLTSIVANVTDNAMITARITIIAAIPPAAHENTKTIKNHSQFSSPDNSLDAGIVPTTVVKRIESILHPVRAFISL